ncbi:glycosyltransferase family 4 protein [Rubrivivax sp. JA1026]|uniref:glycosyltransferase family 4 protein n=1 Tax=Rubrivivax sp. JA1026 TaxID=2710888 RepID=UPI0013E98CB4|nr:glycosyltransferase family 4 protein [Rubrivivax sp. JA1026]
MKTLRIAHVVADGRPGGGSTNVLALIDHFRAEAGAEVTLVSQPASYLQEEAARRGVDFVGVDFFGFPGDPRVAGRLARALGARRFDLTHVHGLRAAHYTVQARLRVCLGALVYTVRGLHQQNFAAPLRWLANQADRRVMRSVDARVFVSHADLASARNFALVAPGCEGEVIYNGIDLGKMARLERDEHDIDVLFLGRLDHQKNPVAAARVLSALAADGCRCVLAGDGPLAETTLRVLATTPGGNRVERLGAQPHNDALALVSRARLLLMPSRWEGLPGLPMEAMALGVPTVAAWHPGTAEVIDDGATGVLLPQGDEHGMAQALRRLLDDADAHVALVARGAARVKRLFDQQGCFARYRALYERLLSAGGSR